MIISIIALTVFVRLAHLYFIAPTPILVFPEVFIESDMHMFDAWANAILQGDLLSAHHSHLYQWQLSAAPAEQWHRWYGNAATFHKAPFYAYLVALIKWTFSEPGIPLALLQIAAAGVSVLLLFRVTESLFGRVAAAAAATLFALYGPSINYDVIMLRRPWITLSMLAITLGLVRLQTYPTNARAVGLGVMLGFGILVYEGFIILPITVLGVVLWFFRFRVATRLTGAVVLGLMFPLLCIFIRNYLVGAPITKLAVTGSIVFALFNSAGAHPQLFIADPSSYLPIMEQSDGSMFETVLISLRTFDGIGPAVLFYLKRALALISSYENPDNLNYYYAALRSPLLSVFPGYRLLFATSVVGLTMAIWKRIDISPLLPCGLVALFLLMATAPLSRYRISLAVMFLPLAGCFVQCVWNGWRARQLVPVCVSLLVAATVYGTSYWIEAKVFPGAQFRGPSYYRNTEFDQITNFYLDRDMSQEARDEIQRFIRLRPELPLRDLALLAIQQAQAGELSGARQNLKTVRSNAQADSYLLIRIGDAYWRFLKDPKTALAVYKEALNANPKPPLRQLIVKRLKLLERN